MKPASQRYSSPSWPRAWRPPVRRLRLSVQDVPERLASPSGLARLTILTGLTSLALSGCTFSPPALDPDPGPGVDASAPLDSAAPGVDGAVPPDGAPAPDAPPTGPRDVVHVPEEGWFGGDTAVVWNEDVTIDTTAGTLTGPGTEDLALDVREHDPPGSEIAILHLGDLTVGSGATVRVVGNLPFVVISSGNIRIEGLIDAGARRQTPGAGGARAGQGPGAGEDGSHAGDFQDSGGGGAGHAKAGARGSDGCISSGGGGSDCSSADTANGGAGGVAYGDVEVSTLQGGSGGGTGGTGGSDPCTPGAGGAGGGAVQLYAVGTITVASGGGIQAGGGGGTRGQGAQCAAAAGGGGGSGGVIYLQAERIELQGTLAANGGGGGAGAESGSDGEDGSDGALNATPAAGGSDDGGGASSSGGAGGAGTTAPTQGIDQDENGGGGGGAVGRVVLRCNAFTGAGLVSPRAAATPGCVP